MYHKKIDDYEAKYGGVSKETNERFLQAVKEKKFKAKDIKELKDAILRMSKMTYSESTFIVYMEPEASPRPRLGKFGTFYVKGAMDANLFFADFMKTVNEHVEKISTACKVDMDMYVPIPKSAMNRVEAILAELKIIRPIVRPDWDNFGKKYSDMVQKSLLVEDSLVVDGRVRKFYSFKPRIELKFTYQDKYDSKYNKKRIESWGTFQESGAGERENI